jgi:hypothetical protein
MNIETYLIMSTPRARARVKREKKLVLGGRKVAK